jgi:hypothetical protein
MLIEINVSAHDCIIKLRESERAQNDHWKSGKRAGLNQIIARVIKNAIYSASAEIERTHSCVTH